jgi:hypothetical protein
VFLVPVRPKNGIFLKWGIRSCRLRVNAALFAALSSILQMDIIRSRAHEQTMQRKYEIQVRYDHLFLTGYRRADSSPKQRSDLVLKQANAEGVRLFKD